MTTVIIEGQESATSAAIWAQENIVKKWSLGFPDIFENTVPKYSFIFTDDQDATLFALKWR